jgi:hypothetical protein
LYKKYRKIRWKEKWGSKWNGSKKKKTTEVNRRRGSGTSLNIN